MHFNKDHGQEMFDIASDIASVSEFLSRRTMKPEEFIEAQRKSARNRMECLFKHMADFRMYRHLHPFRLHRQEVNNVLYLPESFLAQAEATTTPLLNQSLGLLPFACAQRLKTLLVCHLDHCAGTGAVDNASGMAAAIKTLELCTRENLLGVGLLVCDGEESGKVGSEAFLPVLRQIASIFTTVIINFDSIGIGWSIEVHSEYGVLPRFSSGVLPRFSLPLGTDADTFYRDGYKTVTFSTFNDRCNKFSRAHSFGPSVYMEGEEFIEGNVCNSKRDTIEELCPANMAEIVSIATTKIRRHHQPLYRA